MTKKTKNNQGIILAGNFQASDPSANLKLRDVPGYYGIIYLAPISSLKEKTECPVTG